MSRSEADRKAGIAISIVPVQGLFVGAVFLEAIPLRARHAISNAAAEQALART